MMHVIKKYFPGSILKLNICLNAHFVIMHYQNRPLKAGNATAES